MSWRRRRCLINSTERKSDLDFIEGVDYFVRTRPFPCNTIYAWAVSLGDGTFDIWLNERVPENKQLEGLEHELRHLRDNHFFRDDLTLEEKEAIAWGADAPDPVEHFLPTRHGLVHVFMPEDAPPGVSFAFTAPDGLQPAIEPGKMVLCDDRRLRPGDIGLFSYGGEILCCQYHKDAFGFTYLFALDRKRSREDIVVPPAWEKDLVCYGRARLACAVELPGM